MKNWPEFLIFLALCAVACGEQKQPAPPVRNDDTITAAVDTAINPYTDEERWADSLQYVRERDSFSAIKPIAVLKTDASGDCLHKLVAAFIDTNGITKQAILFSDTLIENWNKSESGRRFLYRQILKSKRFRVEVRENDEGPKKLFINGRHLRPGIELDTTLAGMWWIGSIELSPDPAYLMKFGAKEYLFLEGYMERCNGNACGVRYYILYDPILKKAVLMEQYRQDFYPGYDVKNNTPVFLYMDEDAGWSDQFNCFIYSGSVYRIERSGKVKKVINNKAEPLHYFGYYADPGDSIILTKGNPVSLPK